jgi:hypothetical protein
MSTSYNSHAHTHTHTERERERERERELSDPSDKAPNMARAKKIGRD